MDTTSTKPAEISLQNYLKLLPKDLIKQAEKNKVRECDEEQKGHFVAYVDDGDETYDVSINISTKGEVTANNCDCKNNKLFCLHKTALLLHIGSDKKIVYKVKAKKKSKTESLLEQADSDALRDWIRELLSKNKDIELSFVHHFAAKSGQLLPEDVVQITIEAVKAVVKNKKNIDATQLKKVVDLWTEVHTAIVNQYLANTANENGFENFNAIIDSCMKFTHIFEINSIRISKYVEGLLKKSVDIINSLFDEETWKKATGFYMQLLGEKSGLKMLYLAHLTDILSISNEERKKELATQIAEQFLQNTNTISANHADLIISVFTIVETNGLLPIYLSKFKPLRYENDFNEKLIELLIGQKSLELAKEYCLECIETNYRDEYNVPYLILLKKIYLFANDQNNLAKVLERLFPLTFCFEDYLLISQKIDLDEDRKKWRSKMLARAVNAARQNNSFAAAFVFSLMAHEKKFLRMIEYLTSYTPYEIIIQYFDLMVSASKEKLLNALITRHDSYGWGSEEQKNNDRKTIPALTDLVMKNYHQNELKLAISKETKRSYYFRPGMLVEELMIRLNLK